MINLSDIRATLLAELGKGKNLPCHVAAFCAWIMADNDRLRQCADEAIGFTGQARHPPARDGASQWRRAFAAEARAIRRPRPKRETERKSGGEGKRESVRVDHGGRWITKKKNKIDNDNETSK